MQQELPLGDDTTAPQPEDAQVEQRRAEYRRRLAEKLNDPEFRKIEGFPIGTDEAILALSDPPHYTACPNPFLEEWLRENAKPYDPETDDYHREPFAADVSEGKNDPIYNAHSYHTKVPHKAIMRYILHYTEPGDVVYDGFCGTGMTGVAAQMCGNREQVESLGYGVQPDGTILDETGQPFSRLGARKAVLNDLSPAATFIAYNYNTPVDAAAFEREAKRILAEVEEECGWMYSTLHDATPEETERIAEAVRACKTADELRELYRSLSSGKSALLEPKSRLKVGRINYTVWSDVLNCPECGGEIDFWTSAVDADAGKVRDTFRCVNCQSEITKRRCERAWETVFDSTISARIRQSRQQVAYISYSVGRRRHQKDTDCHDRSLTEAVDALHIPDWFPTDQLVPGDKTSEPIRVGITHAHHFYTKRNLRVLAKYRWYGLRSWLPFSALTPRATKMHRIAVSRIGGEKKGVGGATVGVINGTLFVPSLSVEMNVIDQAEERIRIVLRSLFDPTPTVFVSTQTSSNLVSIPDAVDYVFIDPPFGANLMYSELNFLWESWLLVRTDRLPETISNNTQQKGLHEYQALMAGAFARFYEAIKPGRWMTVEFHNSANSVWNAIQEALEQVGFVVADVRSLDKQQGNFNQATAVGAVKVDLVISCYKPKHDFEQRFQQLRGQVEGVVEFIRQHLSMLPVAPVTREGRIEQIAERTRFLLFDRMVAYHLQRGAPIPMSAAEFYGTLGEQFVERDGMYFLPDQAARYDAVRVTTDVEPLSLFVKDERTAMQWVRARLAERPQTLGELTPKFMQEIQALDNYESLPELRDLLRENFILGAEGQWRVPDPDSEKDLEAIRRKNLLTLFERYAAGKGPLKSFRKEAVLEGFRYCWQSAPRQCAVIVAVADRIPPRVLDEIHELKQFADIARDFAPEPPAQATFRWEA